MKTIETFLPVFSGFYGTLFEAVINSGEELVLEDEKLPLENIKFDYETFKNDIAKGCVGAFECEFNRDLKVNLNVTFQALISPRFYNFENDSINVAITLSDEDFEKIKNTVEDNREEVSKILIDLYSSREGFISNYSTNLDEWLEDLEDGHRFGSILNILCEVLDILDEEAMVDKVIGDIYLDYEII